jgi:hypothetical protein
MRKDVECTFGILKGRWRILKSGIHLHSAVATDRIWFTCCAFHNWLLEVDGLDKRWESGVRSEWQGELGNFDAEDAWRAADIPDAIRNLTMLSSGVDAVDTRDAMLDTSGMLSLGMDAVDTRDATLPDGTRIVRKLSQKFFRERLVEHFDIVWKRNELVWPRCNGPAAAPTYP